MPPAPSSRTRRYFPARVWPGVRPVVAGWDEISTYPQAIASTTRDDHETVRQSSHPSPPSPPSGAAPSVGDEALTKGSVDLLGGHRADQVEIEPRGPDALTNPCLVAPGEHGGYLRPHRDGTDQSERRSVRQDEVGEQSVD